MAVKVASEPKSATLSIPFAGLAFEAQAVVESASLHQRQRSCLGVTGPELCPWHGARDSRSPFDLHGAMFPGNITG